MSDRAAAVRDRAPTAQRVSGLIVTPRRVIFFASACSLCMPLGGDVRETRQCLSSPIPIPCGDQRGRHRCDVFSLLLASAAEISVTGLHRVVTGVAFTVILGLAWAPPESVAGQEPPTFSRDVAAILHTHCVVCHRPNAIGGFPLVTYREARPWARAIREQVLTGQMPPWKPVAGFGQFQGERSLSSQEVEVIQRWVEAGAPEGDPRETPPPPPTNGGWLLGGPDLVVRLDDVYTLPRGSEDTFRNFVLPIPLAETRYVRTLELRPGGPDTVHHAIMAIDDTASSRRRDAQDAAPGFDGMDMGQAFMPDGHLVGWTPGMSPFPGLEHSPWRVDPGTDLVLQLHLLASERAVPLRPEVGFFFADGPPSGPPMVLIRLDADHRLDIPAGAKEFAVSDSVTLPVAVTVYSVYPHAHLLGRRVEGWAILPDGTREWLIKIDDWDFGWQDIYRLAEPVSLPAGSTLHMRFRYDNSATNPANPSSPPRRVTAVVGRNGPPTVPGSARRHGRPARVAGGVV